jgi:hypothetical protein
MEISSTELQLWQPTYNQTCNKAYRLRITGYNKHQQWFHNNMG